AGESLARLARSERLNNRRVPLRLASALISGVLHGLYAAHQATDESGAPLHVVHRDVSPQNVLVGSDGVARLLDFGVAKAVGQAHVTTDGALKGKLPYMAPEQLSGGAASAQTDIYSCGVLLWELVTCEPLFKADNEGALMSKILNGEVAPPSVLL